VSEGQQASVSIVRSGERVPGSSQSKRELMAIRKGYI
jgi:hypothetical protein